MTRSAARWYAFVLLPLLPCGCGNVNEDLVEAAADRDNDAVNVLTAEGADPSTALIMALQRGRVDAMQPLLDNGADPSSKDEAGTPAIVVAATLGQTESVRALTGGVSTLDDVDAENRTALMWAVENGYPGNREPADRRGGRRRRRGTQAARRPWSWRRKRARRRLHCSSAFVVSDRN